MLTIVASTRSIDLCGQDEDEDDPADAVTAVGHPERPGPVIGRTSTDVVVDPRR